MEYTPTVSVIGSRSASSYGLRMADFIASELAAKGIAIVSGLAAGIDSRAGEAALAAGGKSYAVLGCGVNICYPKENYVLFSKLCEDGNGILSEFPPDELSRAWHFPDRNRLIAALGDCLCVLEAREQQSGSSITVGSAYRPLEPRLPRLYSKRCKFTPKPAGYRRLSRSASSLYVGAPCAFTGKTLPGRECALPPYSRGTLLLKPPFTAQRLRYRHCHALSLEIGA